MRSMRRTAWAAWCLAATLAISGCGSSEPETAPVAASSVSAKSAPVLPPARLPAALPPDAVAPPPPAPEGGSATDLSSKAPYNFFAPPKVEVPVVKQNDTREDNEPVRLIGFVDVERLKALLAFDGSIRAMEVGDVHKNVEIVAIEPPRVTLQRGRQRWITELFDQPLVNDNSAAASTAGKLNGPQVTISERSDSLRRDLSRIGAAADWLPGGLGNLFGGQQPGADPASLPPLPGFPGGEGGFQGLPGLPPLPGAPTQPQ